MNDEQIYRGIVSNCFSVFGVCGPHDMGWEEGEYVYVAPPACSALSDKRLIILP